MKIWPQNIIHDNLKGIGGITKSKGNKPKNHNGFHACRKMPLEYQPLSL